MIRAATLVFVLLAGACDDAASSRRGDAGRPPDAAIGADATLPRDGATPVDGGAAPVGAPCREDGECEVGICIHGVCSTRCGADQDCADGQVCVDRGGAARCTARCDTVADCAPGLICPVLRPGVGFCVAPGPAERGEPCAAPSDCDSWVCSGDRCLALCGEDGACPPSEVCLPLHTESVCVPAGEGEDEAPCRQGDECRTGVCRGGRCTVACRPGDDCPHDRTCIGYAALALCERRCARAEDCGDTGICMAAGADRLCATRGATPAGEACADRRDCASGRCDEGVCLHACRDGCPAGTACVRELSGGTCRSAGPGAPGQTCAHGEDCASGYCASGRCGADCADGGPCPDGQRCAAFSDGAFCFPACRRDEDCPSTAYCEASVLAEPVCYWRGPLDADAACDHNLDCASGRCAAGRCMAGCPDGQCPAGLRCVDFDTAPLCSPDARPAGAACDADDDCAGGLRCTAGRCLPPCEAGCPVGSVCHQDRCHPTCAGDADCRPGRLCNPFDQAVPFCQPRGEAPGGTACEASGECATGLCFKGRCRDRCAEGCADGEGCVALGGRDYCLPVGARGGGSPCVADSTCASGLCVGRRCAVTCLQGDTCPPGVPCTALRAGRLCVWGCDVLENTGCAVDEVCDPTGEDGDGRCALPGGGAPSGQACGQLEACAAGVIACLDGFCRAPCALAASGPCGPGWSCTRLGADDALGACVPAGELADMSRCATPASCGSGRCERGYAGGRCVRPCADDGECPGDARCVDLARDPAAPRRSCAPRCAGACPVGLACRWDAQGRDACY